MGQVRAEQLLMQLLYCYKYREGNGLLSPPHQTYKSKEGWHTLRKMQGIDSDGTIAPAQVFYFDNNIMAVSELPPITVNKSEGSD